MRTQWVLVAAHASGAGIRCCTHTTPSTRGRSGSRAGTRRDAQRQHREDRWQDPERLPTRDAQRQGALLPSDHHSRHPLPAEDVLHARTARGDPASHRFGDERSGKGTQGLWKRRRVRGNDASQSTRSCEGCPINGRARCSILIDVHAASQPDATVARDSLPSTGARHSSAAPATNSSRIDTIDSRGSPVSFATVPVSSGPSTAANLPIML